jgi:hypothetical protein
MLKAKMKKMPLIWAGSICMVSARIIFPIILRATKPISATKKSFDLWRYIWLSRISNLEVFIKIIEKSMPMTTELISSGKVGLNIGKINILAPVAMNNGGRIIFFAATGFFVFLNRTKLTTTTMSNDTTIEAISKNCFVNIIIPSVLPLVTVKPLVSTMVRQF